MDNWQSLLERFLRNECTNREKNFVYYALRDGLIDEKFEYALESYMNNRDVSTDVDSDNDSVPEDVLINIRMRISQKKAKPVMKRRLFLEWIKIAAAIVITISVSWFAFHTKTPEKQRSVAINTIRVPAGQTVNLTLADGTNIWLNARSTLQYPSDLTADDNREVFLDGEGFFDVAKNQQKPFVVHTDRYDIQALGTQFNVDAYVQEDGFVGSLFEGSVRITSTADTSQTIVLLPNTMARINEGRLITENITDYNHYRWREGLISFKDMPFPELITRFEKCYDIKIILQNNRLKNYAPTGKFRQSDGIDYALRVLQHDFRFRFERDEENHTIYIK